MHGRHDPILVVLSVLIACLAGYVALDLAGRVTAARGSPRQRAGWLTGGALAMGVGIWDMHFIGMLAFGLHAGGAAVPIAYDVRLVGLSVAVAVVASALALAAVSRERLAPAGLAMAALLMGAAIAGMHYIGMAAMRVTGGVSYAPSLVVASVVIAVVASGVALTLAFRLRGDESGRGRRRRAAAAGLIGVAIAGMHYTAMAAARFTPAPPGGAPVAAVPSGSILATDGLAWSVGASTLVILVLALLGSALDRLLRARVARAAELQRLYEVAERARVEAERAQAQLEEQAAEMEQQVEEAQSLAEELEHANEELRWAVTAADRAAASAETAAARTARLQAVTAALSATLTPAEVARVVMEHGLAALEASAGSVATVDAAAGELTLIDAVGYRTPVGPLGRVSLDDDFPLAEAARTGAPILLATAGERAARYPRLAALLPADGTDAMAAVPLTVDGRVVGALGIDFPPGAAPTDDDRSLLLAFAQQCAQALERARLFEAERAAVAAAERANQAKSDFLATMSHELRTPLNAVIGYAELMALGIDGPLTPAQAGRLERIQASSTHLRDLVNEVLDLAQIESGELALRVESAGVVVAVDAALALIAPQAAARGVELAAACGGERAARYLGDAQRVRQIVVNLLANAVRFTPAGGRVSVRCDVGESPMPDRLAPEPGPWLRLTVEDTGIGIAADHLEAIFEPFVQVESGLTRTRGGTGLGLAISRRLARAMGGELVVESEPGVGSRFTLWLRAARGSVVSEPPRLAAAD